MNWDQHAHEYQKAGAAHLWNSAAHGGVACLWLSPGYGKSMITLHAFKALRDAGLAKNMLIMAPLRVVQTVWAQEIENWASLNGLKAARLHGPKKLEWLKRRDVDIWLINYEGVPWLADMAKAGKLKFGFDVVVADEVRRLKNQQGFRFKAARPFFKMAKYKWGLTGTPASNGLQDLFGQFLALDEGKALGARVTRFRHEYFETGWDGFTMMPRPGAQAQIEAQIKHYIFRADGMLDLPAFVHNPIKVTLDPKARKVYTTLKNEMIAQIGNTPISAANAAVLMGKLKQLANGRVYDESRNIIHVHSAKAEALIELIEELGDEQLLIAYEYRHDLDQLRELLGADLPYIGSGVNETAMNKAVDAWNKREIPFLAAHPASAGHGLNLQKGAAHHILWWGPTFDLDHYIQFNDRLRRQGNTADAVVVHTFVTENSVDEQAIVAREGKATLQDSLLSALTAQFGNDITIDRSTQETKPMTQLQFRSDANQQPPQQQFGQQPGAQQQAPQGNPFGQQPQQQQAPQGHPFGQAQQPAQQQFGQAQQPAQQGNPFGQQPAQQQQAPQGNPFGQQQAIQQDVGANPPPTANQAFASFGVAVGSPNPFGQQQPAQEQQPQQPQQNIQTGGERVDPAQGQQGNPFGQQPAVNDTGWQRPGQFIEDAQVVQQGSWTDPVSGRNQANNAGVPASIGDEVPTIPSQAPTGMVPLYMFVPTDKLDKVLSAIARAIK